MQALSCVAGIGKVGNYSGFLAEPRNHVRYIHKNIRIYNDSSSFRDKLSRKEDSCGFFVEYCTFKYGCMSAGVCMSLEFQRLAIP